VTVEAIAEATIQVLLTGGIGSIDDDAGCETGGVFGENALATSRRDEVYPRLHSQGVLSALKSSIALTNYNARHSCGAGVTGWRSCSQGRKEKPS
jgi:hypothetical protein